MVKLTACSIARKSWTIYSIGEISTIKATDALTSAELFVADEVRNKEKYKMISRIEITKYNLLISPHIENAAMLNISMSAINHMNSFFGAGLFHIPSSPMAPTKEITATTQKLDCLKSSPGVEKPFRI